MRQARSRSIASSEPTSGPGSRRTPRSAPPSTRRWIDSSRETVERLLRAGFRGDETVVDIGGGNGSVLMDLLAEQPGLHGIVFDLPETVRDESQFGDRLEFVGGSFFESVPHGDVYILSTILHDWDDEPAAAILRTVRAAAPDHARLVVLDAVIQPGNEPSGRKWLDLLMLAASRVASATRRSGARSSHKPGGSPRASRTG